MACNIFHLFGDLLQQSGSVSCPLAGILSCLPRPDFMSGNLPALLWFAALSQLLLLGSQIVAFLMPHWNHICIGALHRYLCFFPAFPAFSCFSTPTSVHCLCWKWKLSLCAAFLHLRPFNLLLLQSITLQVQQFEGKTFAFVFPTQRKVFCVCVCVCLHWIMKVSGIQTNIIATSSFCLLHWEIIARDWTGISSWSTTWSSSQDSSNTFRLDLWSAS